MTCGINPNVLGEKSFVLILDKICKIFFDFKPQSAKKSVTTSSIWLPVLVDHWVESVGGREFTDWLLLARVCRGFFASKGLQGFAEVPFATRGGGAARPLGVCTSVPPVIRQSNTLAPIQLKTTMPLSSASIQLYPRNITKSAFGMQKEPCAFAKPSRSNQLQV